MNEPFTTFFEWVEASAVSMRIRESIWLYPFIEIMHIFGIVLVAGGAVFFDLQLLLSKHLIEKSAYRLLTWSKRGLLIAIPSGLLLFATNATALSVVVVGAGGGECVDISHTCVPALPPKSIFLQMEHSENQRCFFDNALDVDHRLRPASRVLKNYTKFVIHFV